MKEKLSALIDAELSELEERHVLTALAHDSDLRSAWERYHLIRAAMTRQLSLLAPKGLPERILQGLGEQAQRATPRYWHYAGGAAIAASVAAIALVGMQALYRPPAPAVPPVARATVAPAPAASTAPASAQGLNPYLVGHNEFMPTAGMGGMLPYVRVVTLEPDK